MQRGDSKSLPTLGFLTVVDHPEQGLFGGYLVLNIMGRPLEFHCTAPVRPSRAQQILYGPTLDPYLFGERIGLTLVEKSKLKVSLFLTDCPAVLALRDLVETPLTLVDCQEEDSSQASPGIEGELIPIEIGEQRMAVLSRFHEDRQLVEATLKHAHEGLELAEPFQRIREAISEANKAA